jgi:N-dimethylarginine dimethylaminohydrolase
MQNIQTAEGLKLLNSHNEWDPLKEVIVGSATNAHLPKDCSAFRNLEKTTKWRFSSVPSGLVESWIVEEANEDLDILSKTLESLGVRVHRPRDLDFKSFDGMYNYCPRDRALIVGDKVVDAPMLYPTRKKEIEAIAGYLSDSVIRCTDSSVIFDAANICRLGKDLLYLVSDSGNRAGAQWLQHILKDDYTVHILENIYSGVHIDSTISPVREGLVVLNADRINESNVPEPLKSWDKIWISGDQLYEQQFCQYPYASKYIGLNFLTVDPTTVICDPRQTYLRTQLEKYNVTTIGVNLRHSRTLGGGHHCVTLDLVRLPS